MSDSCELCGLSLRHGATSFQTSGKTYRFCCMGCRQVFTMLMDAADAPAPEHFRETDLFRQCLAMGIIPASEDDLVQRTGPGVSSESDTRKDRVRGTAPTVGPDTGTAGQLPLNLSVDGMWCPACAWVIAESLKKQAGVLDAACNFSTDTVSCTFDPVATSPDRIVDAVNRLGYTANPAGTGQDGAERRRMFVRFGISAFLTMNVMMLSFSLYTGFFTRLPPDTVYKLSWPMFFMATAVLFYGGWPILKKAWAGVAALAPGMETLIAMGAVSAYLFSTFNLATGSIHLYFDTASMLVTLVLLGKILERRAKDAVKDNLGRFFALRPTKVRLCTTPFPEGRYVHADQLGIGDVFRVDSSEIVPADGIILSGAGPVDASAITGESQPVLKQKGDRISSGARVLDGAFKVRAHGVGADSLLGQMIDIMQRSLDQKTPLEGKTDRILLWFVPVVALLAVGTGVVSFVLGAPAADALIRAITVLVISCPCALGIAIPLARVAGVSLAGKKGILVRRFSAFEQGERIDAFVFDKTGTLTEGHWRLLETALAPGFSRDRALAVAAGLEQTSTHYIAAEIRRQAEDHRITPAPVDHITHHDNGVAGRLDGQKVCIGSRGFISRQTCETAIGATDTPDSADDDTALVSAVFMTIDGQPCCTFRFGDRIKESTSPAVHALIRDGYDLWLISGDGDQTTRSVGKKTGIDHVLGDQLPADKAAFIRSMQEKGRTVAMVGDGINDAPALARADLAIAVHSGYHLGREAADITLMRGDPLQVRVFLDLARRVNRKIFQNLMCALVYNVVAIPVAMAGLLTPLVAVCAMLASSLSVTGNTLLLLRKDQ